MMEIRKASEIYSINGGFFRGKWHFSFGDYYDGKNAQFGTLRVLNDDTFIPGAVWPLHPHREMEIITYVVEGEFRHVDDQGEGSTHGPGEIHYSTIGKGMMHSVVNPSKKNEMRLFRIWILPRTYGLDPESLSKKFTREERKNKLCVMVSNKHKGALPINQDAAIYSSLIGKGKKVAHEFEWGKGGYFTVVRGKIKINGKIMNEGDAAKVWEEEKILIVAEKDSEIVLIEVSLKPGAAKQTEKNGKIPRLNASA